MLAGDGTIVGAVLVGTTLSTFVPRAKAQALADITIYDSVGVPVATTFPVALTISTSPLMTDGANAPVAGLTEQKTVSERGYKLLYNQLRIRGDQWGWYSVGLSQSFITTSVSGARRMLALFFAAATLGVLVVGWLLARSLTGPLVRLVQATNAVSAGDLSVRSGVRVGDEIGDLAAAFDAMAARLERNHISTLGALVSSIDARDAYTRGHSVRVGQLAAELGAALSLTSAEIQHVQVGGLLHDIGKIGIRDAVLLKPGKLSDDERSAMQEHPQIGVKILGTVDLPPEVLSGVGEHHERLNGSGYPRGISGNELSLYPRIISVADVYDALITDRPYRAALPLERVLQMLDEEVERGLLDADVVRILHEVAMQWEVRRRNDRSLEGFLLQPAVALVRASASDRPSRDVLRAA